jgi:3-dehydroquinate dehydratase-2
MARPIFVLNGPNLNLLGQREPHIYGTTTLAQVQALAEARAREHGLELDFRQTNHEGVLVDWLQDARTAACAVVINPAAYSHTSIALLDAIKALEVPVVELHLSNPAARESYRRHSYVSEAATGVIMGFGAAGYGLAVDAAVALMAARTKGQ